MIDDDDTAVKISAIVVTYNGAKWLDRCLGALEESIYPVEIIVVDNHSTDDTVAHIRQRFPRVQTITNDENLGFGKANNLGIDLAIRNNSGFFFLINQDVFVSRDTVGALIAAFKQSKEFGVLSPLHLSGDGSAPDKGFANCLLKDYSGEAVKMFFENADDKVYPSRFINAAAWMMSYDCVEKVGGFGSLFFHYGEDRDYTNRMAAAGCRLGFITSTRIFHDRAERATDDQRSTKEKLFRYYFIGSTTDIVDIRKSAVNGLMRSFLRAAKELSVLFFQGRWDAFPVFFEVFHKLFQSRTAMMEYRKVISSGQKRLFLKESIS